MRKPIVQSVTEEIERIYSEYANDLRRAQSEQDRIIAEFICELEKCKAEEIRNKIKKNV